MDKAHKVMAYVGSAIATILVALSGSPMVMANPKYAEAVSVALWVLALLGIHVVRNTVGGVVVQVAKEEEKK